MTDAESGRSIRRKRRNHAASASRIVAGGVSMSVTGVLLAGMSWGAGTATSNSDADVTTSSSLLPATTVSTVVPEPPPTQIIVRHHFVGGSPVATDTPQGAPSSRTSSGNRTTQPAGNAPARASTPSVAPAIPAPSPAPPATTPPVTKSRAS